MGLFSSSSKSKSSTSTSTTTKDNSAVNEEEAINAVDRGAAATDSATVNTATVSTGKKSSVRLDNSGQDEINNNFIGIGESLSLGSNAQLNIETLDRDTLNDAFDFGREALQIGTAQLDDAYDNAQISQEAANELARNTVQSYAGFANDKTDDADSTVFADIQQNLLIGGVILATAIYFLQRSK